VKILGVVFSARKEGNCLKCVKYCLERFKEYEFETDVINVFEMEIKPCTHCNYECFTGRECPVGDDVNKIYEECFDADILIFAIPTYGGHLSSLYLAFTERAQAIFENYQEFEEKLRKKINFIIFGNLTAGGDMALHEALYNFANLDFQPETLIFPAREYGKNSIDGDLIEVPEVKRRLDRFIEVVKKRIREET